MPRDLDGVKVGDWLRIVVNGLHQYEQVKSASGFIIETDHFKFTRYGRTWPTHKASISAEIASKDEVERWRETTPEKPRLSSRRRKR